MLVVSFQYLGEGNGNPLQYSCLENPMDSCQGRIESDTTKVTAFIPVSSQRSGHFTKPKQISGMLGRHVYSAFVCYQSLSPGSPSGFLTFGLLCWFFLKEGMLVGHLLTVVSRHGLID